MMAMAEKVGTAESPNVCGFPNAGQVFGLSNVLGGAKSRKPYRQAMIELARFQHLPCKQGRNDSPFDSYRDVVAVFSLCQIRL